MGIQWIHIPFFWILAGSQFSLGHCHKSFLDMYWLISYGMNILWSCLIWLVLRTDKSFIAYYASIIDGIYEWDQKSNESNASELSVAARISRKAKPSYSRHSVTNLSCSRHTDAEIGNRLDTAILKNQDTRTTRTGKKINIIYYIYFYLLRYINIIKIMHVYMLFNYSIEKNK